MRCPGCGADSPAGKNFCGQCGAALTILCHACGGSNPASDNFCGHCGAPLSVARDGDQLERDEDRRHRASAAIPAGEMKLGTVLDCDIVGSTQLTARLGPEGMSDLVRRFLDASATEVRRYGGTIAQFKGDGFLALFGLPQAHEDHVRRALLAALAIQHAVDAGAADRGEIGLSVRIGIDSGLVYYGPVANNLILEPTVIGEPPITAVRLQSEAEPGTVLISGGSYRAARDYARIEPIGDLHLKGIAHPVSAYRLTGVSHRRSGVREWIPARAAVFVDRKVERELLHGYLRQVESGRGQTVGIVGEPGIGKSRLLAEFRTELGDSRAAWAEGRCLSYGAQIPYMLVLDTLRSRCRIADADTREAAADKLYAALRAVGLVADEHAPALLHLLQIDKAGAAPALSNPEAVKTRAFETLRQLCLRASLTQPLILALEDLHWIDKLSEEFLGFLVEHIGHARLLLLATYRPGYRPPWSDKSYAAQILLQPLGRDDSVRLVHSVLMPEEMCGERSLDRVTDEIVARADGNPLFLEELALHAGTAHDAHPDLMVPATIHEVVMARIDRLPERSKRLLQIAAVIGRECPLRLLRAVAPGSAPAEASLRELARLEFLDELPDDDGAIYLFRHALTQETAYGSLLERQRRAYHGAVGEALERLYENRRNEVAELLAFHFGRSDETEKAVDYAILAGEKAQRRWANADALAHFDDVIRRLDQLPDNDANRLRRIDAVLKQGELKLALGRHAEHLEQLKNIHDLVEASNDSRRRASWCYWAGFLQVLTGGHAAVAIKYCQLAAAIAGANGYHDLNGFIASCLAQAYIVAGNLRGAIDAGERALSIFEAEGNIWWASRALWHLSSASNCSGDWGASLSYCRRALDYSALPSDLRLRTAALWRTGSTHIQQGDAARGLQYCEEALALGPTAFDYSAARAVHGYGLIKTDQIDAGVKELSEVAAWFQDSRLTHVRLITALWLAEGHLARDDTRNARALVEDVLRAAQAAGYAQFEGLAYRLMAECLLNEAPVEAGRHVRSALLILDRIRARNDVAKALVTQAKLEQNAGNDIISVRLLAEAYTIFSNLGTRDEVIRVKATLRELQRHC